MATKNRQVITSAINKAKDVSRTALSNINTSISQGSLVVKQGFISALSSMRNADLLVKLSERFSKGVKNKQNI